MINEIKRKLQMPAAVDVEKKVIGALIIDNNCVDEVAALLKPNHFYTKANTEVYSAVLELKNSNIPIDQVSLYQLLQKRNKLDAIGGAGYIAKLSEDISTAANINYHARVVYEKYILREIINTTLQAASDSYRNIDKDVFDLLDEIKNRFEHIDDDLTFLKSERDMFESLQEIFETIKKEQDPNTDLVYKSDIFPSFTTATGGVKGGEMIAISGKDKAGKTTFGLSLSIELSSKYREPACVFTFEMPFDQYSRKNLSIATGTRYSYLRSPGERRRDGSLVYDDKKILETNKKAIRVFGKTKYYINDELLNEDSLINKIRYLNRKFGVGLILVDYIGLVEGAQKYDAPRIRIENISRKLKQVTNELNLRTIVLSQENDDGSTADSKALRKDCDFWFSIWHPIDDEENKIKIGNYNLDVDTGMHVISFKRTRHTESGGKFLCYYMKDGSFKEIDPLHYVPNMGEDYKEEPI